MPETSELRVVRVYTVRPRDARFGLVVSETDETLTVRLTSGSKKYLITFSKSSKTQVNQRNNWWPLKYMDVGDKS